MLFRSKADPSIICASDKMSSVGMKIKSADRYYSGEAPVGTIFRFSPRLWTLVYAKDLMADKEAKRVYDAFVKQARHASVPSAL